MTCIACSRQCTSRAPGLARTRLSVGLISSAKAAHQQTALATPDAGVALALPDTPYLQAGDVVELEIDGLGRQRQMVGQA